MACLRSPVVEAAYRRQGFLDGGFDAGRGRQMVFFTGGVFADRVFEVLNIRVQILDEVRRHGAFDEQGLERFGILRKSARGPDEVLIARAARKTELIVESGCVDQSVPSVQSVATIR